MNSVIYMSVTFNLMKTQDINNIVSSGTIITMEDGFQYVKLN